MGFTRSKSEILERDDALEWEVPVFRPSFDEFRDFNAFMEKIEKDEDAKECGLVKVIPPREFWSWKMEPNPFEGKEKELARVIQPVKQFVSGRKGSYRIDLVDSSKRPVSKFQIDALQARLKRPSLLRAVDDTQPYMNGEILNDEGNIYWSGYWANRFKEYEPGLKSRQFRYELKQLQEDSSMAGKNCTGFLVTGSFEEPSKGAVQEEFKLYRIPLLTKDTDGEFHVEGIGENVFGAYRITGSFYLITENGETKQMLRINRTYNNKDAFNIEDIVEQLEERDFAVLESQLWKSITSSSTPAMYGGDQAGTIFYNQNADGWNLNQLDTILRVGFGDQEAKGITSSMLYFGMWRSIFAFHTEDMELNSVNFLHYGAPKIWYCIPPGHATRFETLARAEFGDEANRCCEFLRHKNIMFSPQVLRKEKIPFVRAIQHQGEFIFTFPRSYHGGFNSGFNVAEAVNFATPRWLDFGRKARWCKCEKWTFRIDVDTFEDRIRALQPKRLHNEPREGDRLWLTVEEFLPEELDEDGEVVESKDGEPKKRGRTATYLCRLKKGRRGARFFGIPLDKDTCPHPEIPFDPESDTWAWPKNEGATKAHPRFKRRRVPLLRYQAGDENIDPARLEKLALLYQSRKRRLLTRRNKSFFKEPGKARAYNRLCADAKMRKSYTYAMIPPSRLKKLAKLACSRPLRLRNHKAALPSKSSTDKAVRAEFTPDDADEIAKTVAALVSAVALTLERKNAFFS
uniref:JmjC domain-containing protein n=1 Tax=Mucochytrium quahogii TaxID=96639 RepID=A0A7S2WRG2_9STRA|mmetsp:Transcript_20782/g.34364  ORF Transcript_20782/g.34364 Transcript_20782/m.34364 type:complete len:742 (+) Transcript_20782:230-2455(+)|eukprot:CAMPEP_0203757580 /NCGR_PEP_ID=MMETSP0098-20131031/10578_1 /ASSEMBLY_ACC=CAM_ASM_000208 /TAXON_ID=96639 /ORGANISM=" , Strain NY0313808BC1" /LENGTH=741 /DNA_ID=CAMNT_0050649801 /DNA_START=1471 /DNA_END=3696 /DNA_ORIENTATION=+